MTVTSIRSLGVRPRPLAQVAGLVFALQAHGPVLSLTCLWHFQVICLLVLHYLQSLFACSPWDMRCGEAGKGGQWELNAGLSGGPGGALS